MKIRVATILLGFAVQLFGDVVPRHKELAEIQVPIVELEEASIEDSLEYLRYRAGKWLADNDATRKDPIVIFEYRFKPRSSPFDPKINFEAKDTGFFTCLEKVLSQVGLTYRVDENEHIIIEDKKPPNAKPADPR